MKRIIFNTTNDWAATISRIALGGVLFAHGAQKLLGWFDGPGFSNTMGFFTENVGLPWIIGFLVIIIEFFGSLAVILGFATRIWSVAIAILTLGIVQTTHLHNGFFMNWFGAKQGEGYEYFILMLGLAINLIIAGAGKYSIDAWITNRLPAKAYHDHAIIEQHAFIN